MFGFGKKKDEKKTFEPITVENELGMFTLERFKRYDGKIFFYYSGDTNIRQGTKSICVSADVFCDGGADCVDESYCADKGFARLKDIVENFADWDERLKKCVLDEVMEPDELESGMIAIWGSSDDCRNDVEAEPVSKEEFLRRIYIRHIDVFDDGSLQFMFCLDDMYTDHQMDVIVDKDGNITECKLEG